MLVKIVFVPRCVITLSCKLEAVHAVTIIANYSTCTFLQLTSNVGEPNLLTAKTGDQYWRLVRKGVAAAFNPQNMRFVGIGSLSRHVAVCKKGVTLRKKDGVVSPEDLALCL